MNGLHEMQRQFSAFVWGQGDSVVTGVEPNGFDPEQRLAIYRNNTVLGLTEALRAVYPVIDRLLGEKFFNRLSREYIRQHPPTAGCLLGFGHQFPDFLGDYRPAAHLPYLSDMARLEWLRHEVYFEVNEPPINLTKLTEIPGSRCGDLRLKQRAAVRLLISDYPVLRIWQSNQEHETAEDVINLAEGGCSVLVYRAGWEVEMESLDWSQYRFLVELDAGLSLGESAADILSDDPGFDLMSVIRLCISRKLFSDYVLNEARGNVT